MVSLLGSALSRLEMVMASDTCFELMQNQKCGEVSLLSVCFSISRAPCLGNSPVPSFFEVGSAVALPVLVTCLLPDDFLLLCTVVANITQLKPASFPQVGFLCLPSDCAAA